MAVANVGVAASLSTCFTARPNLRSRPRDFVNCPWPGLVLAAKTRRRRVVFGVSNSDGSFNHRPSTTSVPSTVEETVSIDQEKLEGVIQFDKPRSALSSSIAKWGRVALLAGGDVLALLLFSALGRFSHGFPVFSIDTLHTADPFIAGWFLSAYFLGGYAEEGRGMKGRSKALVAAAKSWGLGIPLGVAIRSTTSGHIPAASFILVTMGSTAVLLIGWRALLFSVLPTESKKKDDMYRKGSAFELFEVFAYFINKTVVKKGASRRWWLRFNMHISIHFCSFTKL
ncbi:unnamed protein product [Arabis nemorensis]|uniref:Transmembrane protein n=1 Tax=Arabis nemorensis TaxID=586526 RepID=A0A565CV22_9BRAS|nr:unnamed protein product [Arabis nemorensis]